MPHLARDPSSDLLGLLGAARSVRMGRQVEMPKPYLHIVLPQVAVGWRKAHGTKWTCHRKVSWYPRYILMSMAMVMASPAALLLASAR